MSTTFARSEYAVMVELDRLMMVVNDDELSRRYPRDMYADVYDLLDLLPARTLAAWNANHTPELRKIQALKAERN